MKKIFLALLILLSFSGYSFSQKTDSKSGTDYKRYKDINILHWNDFHARNQPYKITKKDSVSGIDNSYYVGGTSGMLGYIEKYRSNNTLLLNAGDDFQGSPISTFTKGKSQIDLLNLYHLDAYVIGNHEFDYGINSLDSVLADAQFDYLCANAFEMSKNKTIGKKYVIKKVNGVKIGIIGLTALDLMSLTLPKNVSDIRMLNTDSVVNSGIKYLKKKKCDLIILLTHVGVDNDKMLAKKFYKDVDIIVGGHSHTPLFRPVIQNGVVIVQAGSYGRYLGEMDLRVDRKKDTLVSYKAWLTETVMDSAINDKAAGKIVDNMLKDTEKYLSEVIGKLEVDWKRGNTNESNLGQWETDEVRRKTGTDIALLNSGGIRKDLYAGNITIGDIWEINPFGNTIVKFNVTGKMLKEMFENFIGKGLGKSGDDRSSGDRIIISGIKIDYDSKNGSEGNYIKRIKVNGDEISDDKYYSVSTNNFVGSQFAKYFGEVSGEIKVEDTGIIDRDLFIEAVKNEKVIRNTADERMTDISDKE
ncbi:MAG: bifunctional metallophosphatase/5'-nucleotidase [Bacteroidetes bacterium]|nr:bifunctional metallophosphatase/5'-nucleotidase [Bacteroidota bacterium]